jgi:hypothetical protein
VQKSALSLDKFARAKHSTYDKRAVLEKARNLAAAKVNKYRKVQKRLGDSVDLDDAFDPEKYAARMAATEVFNPTDDGMGGRGGGVGTRDGRERKQTAQHFQQRFLQSSTFNTFN